jgi:large subunit ribosomal protein L10
MAESAKKIQKSKIEAADRLKREMGARLDFIVSDFRGMSFPQMTELRAKLGEKDATYKVVRNAFTRIAMRDLGLPDASAWLEGPTALAFTGKDPGGAAKVMMEFTRSSPLKIKGGVVAGKLFTAKDVESLSRLPSRDQLLAMVMATMNAPLTGLLRVMNGVSSKLVRTLQAVADKKGKEAQQ